LSSTGRHLRDKVFVDALDASTTMSLNLAAPPLDDQHVRKAVSLAIDKEALIPILARDFSTLSTVKNHIGLDSQENNLLANYAPYGAGGPDLASAQEEMAQSKYDEDGDGVCDADACTSVRLAFPGDDVARSDMAASIKDDLAPLGIDVIVDPVSSAGFFSLFSDPSQHVHMVLSGFFKDIPNASDFFTSIFSSDVAGNGGDLSLLGATGADLKKWGYAVRSVPNVDDRMQACTEQVFQAQLACWANFDQFLMEQVVPWVPLLSWSGGEIVSDRVRSFSFDQSTPFPAAALDRVKLAPGSEGAAPSP
jgi:ABC-type transport system substrate-binding protein